MDLCDPGMLEPGEDLGFVAEAFHERGCDQSGADHLQRDGAAGIVLFGFVDGAHAPFAVAAENAIAPERRRHRLAGEVERGADASDGALQEFGIVLCLGVDAEELFDGGPQVGVVGTALVKKRAAPRRSEVGRVLEQRFDGFAGWLRHVGSV